MWELWLFALAPRPTGSSREYSGLFPLEFRIFSG